MATTSFARAVVTSAVAALALLAVSCSRSNPGVEFSHSPAPNGDDGIPDTGPTTEEPATPEPPLTEPSLTEPSEVPPTTDDGDDGPNGFFFSAPGTYQIETDRMVLGADRFLVLSPKVWLGANEPQKFPRVAFLATDTGAFLSTGGTWTNASSRALKDHLRRVDGERVLRALARLPISTWHYRSEATGVRHLGPMAEDFFRAFRLGADRRHIATVDADGVTMAALQALARRSARQDRTIAGLRAELRALATRVSELEANGTRSNH
jgi:hypothetical protein